MFEEFMEMVSSMRKLRTLSFKPAFVSLKTLSLIGDALHGHSELEFLMLTFHARDWWPDPSFSPSCSSAIDDSTEDRKAMI